MSISIQIYKAVPFKGYQTIIYVIFLQNPNFSEILVQSQILSSLKLIFKGSA
jgi:hypothetical protein